jgi:hypothetical protein
MSFVDAKTRSEISFARRAESCWALMACFD